MTTPQDPNDSTSEETQRARWLTPFQKLNAQQEIRIRSILIDAAQGAYDEIEALAEKKTFSAAVRTAQQRMVLVQVRATIKDMFGEILTVVRNGQKDAAVLAVDALGKSDRDYLAQALGNPLGFQSSQAQSAKVGIANAISSITKSDYKLSSNVYKTSALANQWLKNQVTALVLRGSSAQEIAKSVRGSIRPSPPGGAAYAALRLGRTELNNAFHATAVSLSQDRPWIEGMDWHLSKVHNHDPNRMEKCEEYAQIRWDVDNVPAKPHPQCRCFVTPRLVAYDEFIRHLTAGQYRSWIDDAA